jgi:Gpi18-like mannosyltransferase
VGVGQAAAEWPGNPLVQAGVRWDAGWYEQIARDGYWYKEGQQSPVAFFPGYPLTIRALMAAGVNRFLAGELISLVCGLLGIFLFAKWAQTVTDPRTALLSTLLLIVYPFSFYLYGVMYSDALFLALVVGAFYALERDRVWLATLLGALATGTRPVAPAVVLGLLVRRLELRHRAGQKFTPVDFVPVLAASGMALYMAYLWKSFGDPLAFAHTQAAPGWDHTPELRTWLKITWFETVSTTQSRWVALRLVGHMLLAVYALVLAVPTRKYLGWGYAVYIAAAVGIPAISSKDMHGLGRYVIAAFPCFVTLALMMRGSRRLPVLWVAVSSVVLLLLAAAFGATAFVA